MRRNCPFLLIGFAIASGVISGCGGDEFGTIDPGSGDVRDGAADGKSPGIDGSSSGGSGGTGGAGGSGASGGSSGAGGGGGTGGSAGKDAGSDSGGGKGGTSADAASDGRTDDGLRADADAGRSGDVLDAQGMDTPTGSDGPATQDAPGDSAADGGRDISVSPDASGSDVVCSEPITYYKDVDGDGFGVSTNSTISCTPPGNNWSVLVGDCRDDLPNVKPYTVNSPDPPVYSGVGYTDMAKPQGVSFDYDCTGTEDADPANAYGAEPNCALLNCNGVGYASVNPARTGAGIDPRCGSTTLHRCNGNILNCLVLTEVTSDPYRCR